MTYDELSTSPLFLICGTVILFVMAFSVFFMVRAWKAGIAIGMDKAKLRKTVVSSITFTLLPSVSILLGVVALSGTLGLPLPWMRLSVIGALQYELPVAEAAAKMILPSEALKIDDLNPTHFTTIALVMSASIIWGGVMSIFFNKRYTSKLQKKPADRTKKKGGANLGDLAMIAMFTGLVASNIGSYIGAAINSYGGRTAEKGVFSNTPYGNTLPLVAVAVSALAMAVMTWLVEKKKVRWLEDFSLAGSMLIGMAAVVVVNLLCGTPATQFPAN